MNICQEYECTMTRCIVSSLLLWLIGIKKAVAKHNEQIPSLQFATCIVVVTDVLCAFDVYPSNQIKKRVDRHAKNHSH